MFIIGRRVTTAGLTIQTARAAPSGEGKFLMLGASKMSASSSLVLDVPSTLSNAHTALASKWVYMLGQESVTIQEFGQFIGGWVTWVPSMMNNSGFLDLAASYVVDSHCLSKNRTAQNNSQAQRSAISAMKALRSQIAAHPDAYENDMLLTVHMLWFAEVSVLTQRLRH